MAVKAPRRSLTPLQKLKIFESSAGKCHICEQKIRPGDRWDVEHVRPLALDGADDESNMRPAHKACHATKTKADAASWSKAKRIKAKLYGGRKASRFAKPPPGYNYWTRRIET